MEKHGGDDCGDAVAKRLAKLTRTKEGAVDRAALKQLASRNDCWQASYSNLNSGLLRMTISNRLRALARKGEVKWEA